MNILDDKKRAIALSAMYVFQKNGMEKTTVSAIVKRAGIAQGTFYLYFPSKLSVMPAIASILVEKTMDEFAENNRKNAPLTDQLNVLIDTVFSITRHYHDLYAILFVGLGSSKQMNQWETIYEPYYHTVGQIIEKAQKKREMNPSLHAHQTAVMLIGFIESAADQLFLFDHADETAVEGKKQDLLNLLLHGIE